jgi:hypothetical protein
VAADMHTYIHIHIPVMSDGRVKLESRITRHRQLIKLHITQTYWTESENKRVWTMDKMTSFIYIHGLAKCPGIP